MRVVAFILIFVLFGQSLSVCSPNIANIQNTKEIYKCEQEGKNSERKSCCKKDSEKNKNSKKNGCCGDNCNCLTCAKVFLTYFQYAHITPEDALEISEKVTYPVIYHSFDFHPSIAYPPIINF